MNMKRRKEKKDHGQPARVKTRSVRTSNNACLNQFYARVLFFTFCCYSTVAIFWRLQYGYYPAPVKDPINYDMSVRVITATWVEGRIENVEKVINQVKKSLPEDKIKIHPAVRGKETIYPPGPGLVPQYEFGHMNGMSEPWVHQNLGKWGIQMSMIQVLHEWYMDVLQNGNRPIEEYVLITLEDDVKIEDDFIEKVKEELNSLPPSWDSANMGMCMHPGVALPLWSNRVSSWIPPRVSDLFSNTHALAWSFKGVRNFIYALPINVYAWDMFNAWLIFSSQLETYTFCPAIATFTCPSGGDCKKKKDRSASVIDAENKLVKKDAVEDRIDENFYGSGRGKVPWPMTEYMLSELALLIFLVLLVTCLLRRIKRRIHMLLLHKAGGRCLAGGGIDSNGRYELVQTEVQMASSDDSE